MAQREFDVVVLGSGAAALTAAVTAALHGASVGVFEKSDLLGGTSAWSGGQIWIPNNPLMSEAGVPDSRDDALAYILSLSLGLIDRPMAEAFVDAGPAMVRFLHDRTAVQFMTVVGMPDYHPEFPGGKPNGGRTLECELLSFKELGEWQSRITPSPHFPGNLRMTEMIAGAFSRDPPTPAQLEQRRLADERGSGQALIGRLLKSSLAAGVTFATSCRGTELVLKDGCVTGCRFETPEGPALVRAGRGVVLATGGFEWNEEYVRTFLRGPMSHPVSVPTNTGDGLKMAMKAGASLGNMREAWWMPAIDVESKYNSTGRLLYSGYLSLPHSILVNRRGKRFTNEAANYNAFGAAFHQVDVSRFEYVNTPAWHVFDHQFVQRFGFDENESFAAAESPVTPSWVHAAPSLEQLARDLGIPAGSLQETVERWNSLVTNGGDADFLRGESAYDRWWGDPRLRGKKEGTLGTLLKPPYYAVKVHPGALGTKGGPKINTHAQVVDLDNRVIDGLYAAGNVMASPFGMTYGGPGGTLAPGMVFGYLAALHVTGH